MTTKRLYRSRKDRMIWGVAGGLAQYMNVDPTLVRIGFVVLAFAWGAAIIVYILMAIIVPSEPYQPVSGGQAGGDAQPPGPGAVDPARQQEQEASQEEGYSHRRNILGFGLVILGGLILLSNLGWWWNWHIFWPVALIVIGAVILLAGARRR